METEGVCLFLSEAWHSGMPHCSGEGGHRGECGMVVAVALNESE